MATQAKSAKKDGEGEEARERYSYRMGFWAERTLWFGRRKRRRRRKRLAEDATKKEKKAEPEERTFFFLLPSLR